jgi:hypothetical protein
MRGANGPPQGGFTQVQETLKARSGCQSATAGWKRWVFCSLTTRSGFIEPDARACVACFGQDASSRGVAEAPPHWVLEFCRNSDTHQVRLFAVLDRSPSPTTLTLTSHSPHKRLPSGVPRSPPAKRAAFPLRVIAAPVLTAASHGPSQGHSSSSWSRPPNSRQGIFTEVNKHCTSSTSVIP